LFFGKSVESKDVRGLVVPLLTPLNEDLSLDFISFKTHVSWLMNRGVKNFFILSPFGEQEFLSREQKQELIIYAKEALPKKINLIVGCFGETPDLITESVSFAQRYSKQCVVNVPFSALTNEISFIDFFEELFNQTKADFFLYNNPFLFKRNIPVVGFDKIAGWERLLGVIDYSRNIDYFKILSKYKQALSLFQEADELFFDSTGFCEGFAPQLSNIYPRFFVESKEKVPALDYVGLVHKQSDFSSFVRDYFPLHSRIQSAKYLLAQNGVMQEFYHSALGVLSNQQKEKLTSLQKEKEFA